MDHLTPGVVADLVRIDPGHRIVLLAFDAATGALAGGARAVRHRDDPSVADVAVTVGAAHRRRGVGGALLRRLRRAALAEGIERFDGHVLIENVAARALLAGAGAVCTFDEPGVLRFEIRLRRASNRLDGEGRVPRPRHARAGSRGRAA
jgi:RimJ/RimL family protein N-acetyltransferase